MEHEIERQRQLDLERVKSRELQYKLDMEREKQTQRELERELEQVELGGEEDEAKHGELGRGSSSSNWHPPHNCS